MIWDLNRRGQLQNVPTGPGPDDTSVILQLNDDGTIPSDNPFFSFGGNWTKYYAYGIRNSFGLAFELVTHKLWMAESGPDTYDEVTLVDPGFNSGWVQQPASLLPHQRGRSREAGESVGSEGKTADSYSGGRARVSAIR